MADWPCKRQLHIYIDQEQAQSPEKAQLSSVTKVPLATQPTGAPTNDVELTQAKKRVAELEELETTLVAMKQQLNEVSERRVEAEKALAAEKVITKKAAKAEAARLLVEERAAAKEAEQQQAAVQDSAEEEATAPEINPDGAVEAKEGAGEEEAATSNTNTQTISRTTTMKDVKWVEPEGIIEYWFSGTKEEQTIRHWKGLKETDDEIRTKFADTWEALSDLDNTALADKWATGGPHSALALVIVWDQFSRVLWRGDGRSFSNDIRAGEMAMQTIQSEAAEQLTDAENKFLRMPLLHSEILELQQWNAAQPGAAEDSHIQGHLRVMERFGRFPKRNAALGRESTPEEIEYMASPEAQSRPY